MRNTRTHGLTLIEVLVLVAIIAILCAILFPAVAKMRWGRDIKEIETALSPLQSVVNSDRAETVKIGELTFDVLPYMSPDWHRKTGPVIVAKEGSEVVVVVIVWRKTTSRPCVDLVNDLGSRYKRWSVVRAKLGLKQ